MDYSKSGFVYVLQMEGHGYYKIGRTSNLNRRFMQISPQMPGRLILCFAHRVLDAFRIEAELHRDFAAQRLNGEWFQLDQACLEEIKAALLFAQASALFHRLAKTIVNEWDTVAERPVRYSYVLYQAALRHQRREQSYGKIYYSRRRLSAVETDVVLGAEIIG